MSRRAIAAAAILAVFAACARDGERPGHGIGNPRRGKALVREYGCHTCHEIPGVRGATSTVGPPLGRFAQRVYAGGRLNTPPNVVEYILDPPAVDGRTPMPNVGLTEQDARDVAAFLYTLE